METTSINIQPIKAGSEIHNLRLKELDYVRSELSYLNEKWEIDSVANRLQTIQQNYKETTGQTMQKKATPIREGVVVINENTSIQELRYFAEKAERRFGIKAFQIHIHKDEGHIKSKQWKPNLHAHILFDWTQDNGKSCKLNRQDMTELQTLCAECLRMKRGKSSDKKHLSSVQYKLQQEQKRLQELEKINNKNNIKKAIYKATEKFKDILGETTNDREKNALILQVKSLDKEKRLLEKKLKTFYDTIATEKRDKEHLQKEIIYLRKNIKSLEKEACIMYYGIPEKYKSRVRELTPVTTKIIDKLEKDSELIQEKKGIKR